MTERRLMYIDMAHTLELVRQKRHDQFFEMRHSGDYFARVWGVHPLADIAGKQSSSIEVTPFSDRQVIIEGVAESLKLPKWLLPLNFLISQAKLVRLLRRVILDQRISLIACADPYYSGFVGWLLKRLTGRPLLVAVNGNPDEIYEATGALQMPRLLRFRCVERWLARFVLSRADLVTAANRNNLGFAVANGARARTAIIPVSKYIESVHFLLPSERPPSARLSRLGIRPGTPLLLCVGRLLALKHPDEAVRAMALVIESTPDAVGLLAGSGPMQPELEALVEDFGMAGKIHFLGHLDQFELSEITPHCLTLSPLTGIALIECGLGGSPIVAFDRDWQSEFVVDGVSGFVVPFLDHRAMADRALQLINDPGLRARMSKASRERARDWSDVDRIRALEHQAYDDLLKASTP
ncbi:glycosyltransferase [Sphingomonas sp.]|uniref:glycosyltransferase family 4 protein n=1 Tax=Sphingomonas sp. TaxID=28214 RepID=UPI00286CEF10|nr:glycosyltransferase [Sphingomonas sp.]